MVKWVAIKCRISSDDEGRGENVEEQEAWGRAHAAEKFAGMPVKVYVDNDISAADRRTERPGFDQFCADIAAGNVSHVVCTNRNRITRDLIQWIDMADDLLIPNGIEEIHTKHRGVQRVDDIATDIDAVLGRREVRESTRLVRDKHENLAQKGRPWGGARQLGLRNGKDAEGVPTLLLVEDEAQLILDAYPMVFAGRSLIDVARDWNRDGWRTVQAGNPYTEKDVYRVLTNPSIAGMRAHRRNGTEKLYRATWDAIVSEDDRQRMVTWLDTREQVVRVDGTLHPITHSRRPRRRYLLTGGIGRCPLCTTALVPYSSVRKTRGVKTKVPYYQCPPKSRGGCGGVAIRADMFEAQFEDEFLAMLDRPQFRAMIAAGDPHQQRRDEITKELRKIEAKRKRYGRQLVDDEMDEVTYQSARRRLKEREDELRAELAGLPVVPEPIDLDDLIADWGDATLDEKRYFISMFVEQVQVGPASGVPKYDPGRMNIVWRRLKSNRS